jgi:hypothetical protein
MASPQTACILQLVAAWDNWCNIASGFSGARPMMILAVFS